MVQLAAIEATHWGYLAVCLESKVLRLKLTHAVDLQLRLKKLEL